MGKSKLKDRVLREQQAIVREINSRKVKLTPLMRFLELTYQKPIEDIILSGSTRQLEERLGVDHSTIGKWRIMLGMDGKEKDK